MDLKSDIAGYKAVQSGQGRALKKISEGNGLSLRVQQLTDEIRILKQKNIDLSHAVREFERKEIDQ